MVPAEVLQLAREALLLAVVLSLPVLAATAGAGLASAAFRTATELDDPALSTIPRLGVGAVTAVLAAPWIWSQLVAFAHAVFAAMVTVG